MCKAVVLAADPGEALRPLTDEETPTAFLSLGDRRPLLQQWIEHLSATFTPEDVWAIVGSRFRERAEALLPVAVRVLPVTVKAEYATVLTAEIAKLGPVDGRQGTVLLQPAAQLVADWSAYSRCVSAGLDRARSTGQGVSVVVRSEGENGDATGIEAWPTGLLLRRLADGMVPPSHGSEMQTLRLDDAGWIDLSDWEGVGRLLAYVEKPWGHERLWALNRHYAGKVLFIRAGESLSLQYHEIKDETIHIASGRMRLRVGPSADELETVVLEAGMSYAIQPRRVHRMEALEDCTVFEVSTPHLADVVRLEDRYGRTQRAV